MPRGRKKVDNKASLVEADAAQLALVPNGQLASPEQAAQFFSGKKEFTGQELFDRDPEAYRSICDDFANGKSYRVIARTYHVSVNTIRAVVEREPKLVDTLRQRAISDANFGAQLAAERIIEDMDKMPPTSLPMIYGIFTDKGQLLSGQVTARVEHVRPAGEDDFQALVKGLTKGPTIIDAVIIPSDTGEGGGEKNIPGESDRGPEARDYLQKGLLEGPQGAEEGSSDTPGSDPVYHGVNNSDGGAPSDGGDSAVTAPIATVPPVSVPQPFPVAEAEFAAVLATLGVQKAVPKNSGAEPGNSHG